MGGPVAKLAGVPLEGSAANAWALTEGTDPFQGVIEVHHDRADQIMAASAGKEVELEVTRSNGTTQTFGAISVLGAWPTDKPWTTGLLISDRRWLWKRRVMSRSFNERRRTGNTVRRGNDNDAKGVTIPEVQYAPWSLNAGKAWKAIDVLRTVLAFVCGAYDLSRMNVSKEIPVENLILNDDGDVAIQRVLAHFPGNGIYVDEKGVAVVYDKTDVEATAALLAKALPTTGGSLLQRVTFERTRPIGVVCLFERETEIRTDYLETAAGAQTTAVMDPKELRQAQNVLPCPDPTLAIPAGAWGDARTVALGTWITFDEFFAAVNTGVTQATFFGEPLPPFSADIVRQLWTPIGGLLVMVYAGANVAPDPVWTRRINTVLAHYRQTFRLPPRWRDKIRSMRMNRVRIVDTVTGARAPAEAWVDYCVRPTMKRLAAQPGDGQLFGWNVTADGEKTNAADLSAVNLATVMSSRNVTLSTVDDELGIFRLDFRRAPDLGDADVLPSNVDNIPNADPSEATLTWDYAKLSARHRMAAIFTVAQAAPNDERRFHAVTITPQQAEAALGKKIGPCTGPVWYLLCGAVAARFGWSDTGGYVEKFTTAYGAGESADPQSQSAPENVKAGGQGGDAAANAGQGDVRLADLGTPTNDDEVTAVALAQAASLYSSMLDRIEGGALLPYDPSIKPTGHLNGVMHILTPEGPVLTSISLPPTLTPVDMWGLVPETIRRKIRNQVQPPA